MQSHSKRKSFLLPFCTELCDVATFAVTQQGKLKLIHKGFEYNKGGDLKTGTRWECVKRRHEHCKGQAKTQQIGSESFVVSCRTHNHPPN